MEEQSKDSNVKSTIDAVTGLVKAIPVYEDTLQPSAKQIGKSLETITKTVNIALAPVKALVWGYEKIEEFVTQRVSEKLKHIPEENIITPPLQVAGPTIEALRFSGHDENLRELYANLLVTAMNKITVDNAHPGFVEILKNLNSDEALLLQAFVEQGRHPIINVKAKGDGKFSMMFSNFSHLDKKLALSRSDLVPTYIDNLCRLGILEIPHGFTIYEQDVYEPLKNDPSLESVKQDIVENLKRTVDYDMKSVILTHYGEMFVRSVVANK